jgi:hypothetical protein
MEYQRVFATDRQPVFPFGIPIFCFTPPMQPRLALLLMMLALVVAPAVFAGGKKDDRASVSFHMETEATDNPKMIFAQLTNGKTRYFRRIPDVSLKDIESFSPFPSDAGGGDYGVVFKLKSNAAGRLAAITNANQGKWMISELNGRVVDGLLIDKQISDGRLVIWKGVTLADITALEESLPRTGHEGQKK